MKSTTSPQQIEKLYNKSTTNQRQIHNKSNKWSLGNNANVRMFNTYVTLWTKMRERDRSKSR